MLHVFILQVPGEFCVYPLIILSGHQYLANKQKDSSHRIIELNASNFPLKELNHEFQGL